ncbi:MAG: DMT family transporter [Chlamydiales bacterium]
MYALFASTFTVGKVTLQYVDPYFLTGVRMLLAGCILFSFQYIRNRNALALQWKHLPSLFLLGFFNVFITNAFEFWGLQYMETAKTALIYSLSPFFAILLSYFLFKEKMRWKKWLGLFVGLIGFLPIYLQPSNEQTLFGRFSLPEIAVSISAFTCVIGWLIMKRLVRLYQFSFLTANTYSFFFGGIFSLITSFAIEDWHPLPLLKWQPFLFGLIYITIIHNVICYNIYAYSLRRFSLPFMTFAGFTGPLFTAAFGSIFLDERMNLLFYLSFVVIISGLLIYSRAELKTAD